MSQLCHCSTSPSFLYNCCSPLFVNHCYITISYSVVSAAADASYTPCYCSFSIHAIATVTCDVFVLHLLLVIYFYSPSSSLSKKQGFLILSVRRWSDNTAYLVLIVHEVYLKARRKISQIHQITKNQKQYQP